MAEEVGQSMGSGEILLRSVQEQTANTLIMRLFAYLLVAVVVAHFTLDTPQNDPLGFSHHTGITT